MQSEKDKAVEVANHFKAIRAGSKLGTTEAKRLLELASNSDDLDVQLTRLGYLLSRSKRSKSQAAQLLEVLSWLVENHPNCEIHQHFLLGDPYLEEQFKALLMRQAERPPHASQILDNLAALIVMEDPLAAEKLWQRASELEPKSHKWPTALAHLYRSQAKFGSIETKRTSLLRAVDDLLPKNRSVAKQNIA